MFFKLNPVKLAEQELQEAKLSLMRAHSAAEYATALVTYNTQRVERLTAYVAEERERAKPVVPPAPPRPISGNTQA